MAKEKGSNPLQDWRRKEKEKAAKAKRKARDERLAEIPAHRRDPAPLVSEIYRLTVLEYEGKLNSDMKQHKKRLFDQYQSIRKARTLAGLETVELVEFDPEAHEAAKLKQIQSKRQKLQLAELTEISDSSKVRESSNPSEIKSNYLDLDERGFPKLPGGPSPTDDELMSLGLPAYSPFPYEADAESEIDNSPEETDDSPEETDSKNQEDNFDALEAQLEAEYALFKESLDIEAEQE